MNEFFFEKAEAYLKNEMSKEDRQNFEQEVAADNNLKEALQMYHSIENEMQQKEYYREMKSR